MKFLKWFFSFGAKYRKREAEYARRSRKFGTSGEMFGLFLLAAVPLLSAWGLFADISSGLKVACIFGAILILYVPTELMVIGVIALRHRLRMKIENKVTSVAIEKTVEAISGEEITGENKEEVENYEARGTADKYDLTVGILGIVLSVVVVIAFIGILALGATGII